jgi:hypothetical protein
MEKLKQIIEKVLDEHSQSDPTFRTRWDGLGHAKKEDRVGQVLDECTQFDGKQSFESFLKKKSGEFLRMLPLWQNSFLVSTQSVCAHVSLWTARNSAPESSRSRMDLTKTSLGTFDMQAFEEHINNVFDWHQEGHKIFLSPSFAMVQSSGMGKTKLMREYSRKVNENKKNKNDVECKMQNDSLYEKHSGHAIRF